MDNFDDFSPIFNNVTKKTKFYIESKSNYVIQQEYVDIKSNNPDDTLKKIGELLTDGTKRCSIEVLGTHKFKIRCAYEMSDISKYQNLFSKKIGIIKIEEHIFEKKL